MEKSITVIYLKKSYIWDISTKFKLHNVICKITKLILRKVHPIYGTLLVQIYDIKNIANAEIYSFVDKKVIEYIFKNVEEYIRYNDYIDLEGFMIFRLTQLWDVIDNAICEYMKNNYLFLTDFCSTYMDYTRSLYDIIHITATDQSYNVYDDNHELIAYIKKYDDTLLDIIININPIKIFIYNSDKFIGNTLLDNIKVLFKSKVVFDTR